MAYLDFLISAALIALHAQNPKKAFRQRDLRFFSELFANWIELGGRFETFRIHNNQIARQLSQLSKKGAIKRKSVDGRPAYVLTSIGLLSCLQEILGMEDSCGKQCVFFKIYFLSNYSSRIRDLLRSAQSTIPTGLKLEIDPLLDWRGAIHQAISRAEADKKRLMGRINDAYRMPVEVKKRLKKMTWEKTVLEIEKLYPYELNAMKSLSALCANLPEEIAQWELTEGSIKRAAQLWEPVLRGLVSYIDELKKLLAAP